MFQPSQFGAFPCEEGCSFLVLLDFAAIRYTEDRILLVYRNNRNLLEEFHTVERCYLWDEREHRCPLVSIVCVSSLIQNGSGRSAVSDIQPRQLGNALEELAKVLHLVPTRQLDSRDLSADTSEVREERSIPFGSTQFDAFESFQWSWGIRVAGYDGVGEFSVRLELFQAR